MNTTSLLCCCFFSEAKTFENLDPTFQKHFERGMNSSSSSTTITAEWVPELLAGFRFHPKEDQMVNLLKKKTEGKDSQSSQIMPEIGYQTWEPGNQSISLFLLFLTEMMQGKNYPACQFIPEIDVLKSEPWDLPGLMFPDSPYQAREWFAFNRIEHININSHRCHRATEQGFWKRTGQPREIKSQDHSFTCEMRTLTFHIGRVSNSEKTNWVMHEYCHTAHTETKLGSSGFVLVRVKNKSANHKYDSKKLIDSPIASNSGNQPSADVINHVIPAAEKLLPDYAPEDVQFGSGDDHDVSTCKKRKHTSISNEFDSTCKKRKHTSISNEFADPSTGGYIAFNSENQAAAPASNHKITDTEEHLAYQQLVNAVLGSDNHDASNHMTTETEEFLKDLENAMLGSDDHDNGQAGGGSPSDFDDPAVDDMIQELLQCVELEEDQDSPFPPPVPPQLGNVPDARNDKCSNWQSPIGENDSYVMNKNHISTNYGKEPVSNIAYGAPDKRISEEEQNLKSLFDQLRREDYTLEPPFFNSELQGNFSHANNYIGCNGSESPAFFPQRS